jgi:hypothetical protein
MLLVVLTCSAVAWVGQRQRQRGSDGDDNGEGDEGDDDLDLADGADLDYLYNKVVAEAVAAGALCQLLVNLHMYGRWKCVHGTDRLYDEAVAETLAAGVFCSTCVSRFAGMPESQRCNMGCLVAAVGAAATWQRCHLEGDLAMIWAVGMI